MKKRLYKFIIFTILTFFVAFSKAQQNLDSGLVAYYPFTGNAGDSSINNNNPFFNNASLTKDRFGKNNSAYYFNGVNNQMIIANHPSLNFVNKMSICLWMKPMGYYKGRCYNNVLINKGYTDAPWGNQGNYNIRFSDYVNGCNPILADTTKEYLYGPTGGVCTNQNIQTNRWYFVVFTTNGTTTKTYINNKLSNISAHPNGQTFTNSSFLQLGAFGDSIYPYWFNGVLDDIRIYNRALDDFEIQLLYNSSPYPTIKGNIFIDANNNGVKDNTEYGRSNVKINASNGSFALSNSYGDYEIIADSLGPLNTQVDVPVYYSSSPNGFIYQFSSLDTLVESNFTFTDIHSPFDSLSLSVTPIFNAARPGFDYPVSINYSNDGNTQQNAAIYTLPYDTNHLIFINSTNNFLFDNNGVLTTVVKDLLPGENSSFIISFKLKTTAKLGDTLKLFGNLNTASLNLTDSLSTIITGSYDPNDITANLISVTTNEIQNGKFIDYTIRFENTGTDTAFNVKISNLISPLLNLNSLRFISSSHNFIPLFENRMLTINFNNILLPHTAQDKLNSHGYIKYRIKINDVVSDGTDIPNTASIYFDYNLPIITNTSIVQVRNPIITPLKFISLQVKKIENNKHAQIQFVTSNEFNVSHFEIERSLNGINFEKLGNLNAENKTQNNYSFIDQRFEQVSNIKYIYYRIKSIDKDGTSNYSNTFLITNNSLFQAINIFPNPAKNKLNIVRQTNIKQNAKLINSLGQIVKQILLTKNIEPIDIENLNTGKYFIIIEGEKAIGFIKN